MQNFFKKYITFFSFLLFLSVVFSTYHSYSHKHYQFSEKSFTVKKDADLKCSTCFAAQNQNNLFFVAAQIFLASFLSSFVAKNRLQFFVKPNLQSFSSRAPPYFS